MTDELVKKIVKAGVVVGGKLSADKTNKEQNYNYLSADKILSICGQALFDQGVSVLPGIVAQETTLYEYTDQQGKAKRRYDSRVQFEFLITDGTGNQQLGWFGMGSDYAVPDKALYKAITSGHKYFLMKLLCIGEGNEDGEHEADEDASKIHPTAKPAQPAKAEPNGHKPAEPEPTPAMSLEMAESELNSEKPPKRYGDIDSVKLAYMATELEKKLKTTALPTQEREDKQRKLAACRVILAHRTAQETLI